jgi:pentatricopeptide repeat protein
MFQLESFYTDTLSVLEMMRSELFIFVVAILAHTFLFRKHQAPPAKKSPKHEGLNFVQSGGRSPKTSKLREQSGSETSSTDVPARPDRREFQRKLTEDESRRQKLQAQLRALSRGAPHWEVDNCLRQVQSLDDATADEAMLTAVVDCCIRLGKIDFLSSWLVQNRSSFARVKRAHSFSSLIRAYGAVRDVTSVWSTWSSMRKSHVTPTCVTLGCMVEALVSNGDPDSAYDLLHEIQAEEKEKESKSVVNAVIYGTVLKGFAHQKKFSRVWSVYQEMLAIETDFTIVTFNTVIDACARCEELNRIPTLLADMDRLQIPPNIITYGAILKGYCQEGKLDKAYELLQSMRETTNFTPDEIMYNSLLDGCARQGLWDRALGVLVEMEEAKVKPSNFTLSVLVKVGRRSTASLESIFSTCEAVAARNHFKYNVHVYTNLVHACVDRKECKQAHDVFQQMIVDRIRPEVRTYTLLLKGLVQAGEMLLAEGVLRAALGLPRAAQHIRGDLRTAYLRDGLPKPLVAEIVEAVVAGYGSSDELAAQLMTDVKKAGFSIDPRVKLRFAARAGKSHS